MADYSYGLNYMASRCRCQEQHPWNSTSDGLLSSASVLSHHDTRARLEHLHISHQECECGDTGTLIYSIDADTGSTMVSHWPHDYIYSFASVHGSVPTTLYKSYSRENAL